MYKPPPPPPPWAVKYPNYEQIGNNMVYNSMVPSLF